LIIGIPNVACNGGEAGNQSGIQKKFMYIHYVKRLNSFARRWILSRSKTFGNIRTLNFCRTLFSCGFTLSDSINFGNASTQNSYDTLFETTWKRCNNLAKKEIQAGMIAVLHTWGQHDLHLHLYCIVPSGGINKEGNGKTAEGTVNFCSL
jgi:hypothetical protein